MKITDQDVQTEFEAFVKRLGGNIGQDEGQYHLSGGANGYRLYFVSGGVNVEPFASQSLSATEMYHALRFARAAVREYQVFVEKK